MIKTTTLLVLAFVTLYPKIAAIFSFLRNNSVAFVIWMIKIFNSEFKRLIDVENLKPLVNFSGKVACKSARDIIDSLMYLLSSLHAEISLTFLNSFYSLGIPARE